MYVLVGAGSICPQMTRDNKRQVGGGRLGEAGGLD